MVREIFESYSNFMSRSSLYSVSMITSFRSLTTAKNRPDSPHEGVLVHTDSHEGPGRCMVGRKPNRKMGIFSLLTTASLPSYDAIGLKIS